eukprot:4153044-Amphidinium_carterae.1
MTQERLRAHLSLNSLLRVDSHLCLVPYCAALLLATACDERTSANGTSAPLPGWITCSEMPMPSTGTAGLLGPALGGTQSPKERINHSAKVAVVWDVDCLIEGRETLFCFPKPVQRLSGEAPRQTAAKKRPIVLFSRKMMRNVPEQVYSASQHIDSGLSICHGVR